MRARCEASGPAAIINCFITRRETRSEGASSGDRKGPYRRSFPVRRRCPPEFEKKSKIQISALVEGNGRRKGTEKVAAGRLADRADRRREADREVDPARPKPRPRGFHPRAGRREVFGGRGGERRAEGARCGGPPGREVGGDEPGAGCPSRGDRAPASGEARCASGTGPGGSGLRHRRVFRRPEVRSARDPGARHVGHGHASEDRRWN